MVQLEGCFSHRQAGDADRLASEGIPPVLALEVQAGKTSIAEEHPRADCAHGTGESDLGTNASCLGTVPEVGNLRFAQDGAGLLALAARISSQRWRTFVRNHARSLIACDFLVVVTARFRVLYVFVLLEVATRRIVHVNVTAHPTAGWTLQQFRDAIPGDHQYRFLIHDRDSIFSPGLDHELKAFGLQVLRTPVQAPQANAYCERLVGTMRRECLDFLIPFSEKHLRATLKVWLKHYNQGRPHMSLGPGIPDTPGRRSASGRPRHHLPDDSRVVARSVLGGLHHEYAWEKMAA